MFPLYNIPPSMQNEAPIQIMQITPSSICVYNEYRQRNHRTIREIENQENLTRGEFNGNLSPKTKRVITKRLNSWLHAIIEYNKIAAKKKIKQRHKPTFVTLTMPSKQIHTDQQIKRDVLNAFIIKLKRQYDVKHYFWIAETQANGNIHFHIILDRFINWRDIRTFWNSSLDKLGYIKHFAKKHGHSDPNSTDIHIVGGFDVAVKYVVKYVQKSSNRRPVQGRLHGISDSLKNIPTFTTTIDSQTSEFITDAINQKKSKLFIGDRFTVIYCDVFKLDSFKDSKIDLEFKEYLSNVYDYLYNDKDPFQLAVMENLEIFIDSVDLDHSQDVWDKSKTFQPEMDFPTYRFN